MKTRFLLLMLLLIGKTAMAVPVTLVFNGSGENRMDSYTEQGILLTVNSGHYDFLSAGAPNFSYLNIDPAGPFPTSSVRFQLESGFGEFDVLSFDIIDDPRLHNATLGSSAGDMLGITTAGHYELTGPQWTNLTWLDFSTSDSFAGIDNLVLDVHRVPEPSELVMLLTGAGLFFRSYKAKRR